MTSLVANFVNDPSSNFYRSPLFHSVMNFVNRKQGNMTVKQNNNKLSLTVREVSSVAQAIALFNKIQAFHLSTIKPPVK